MTKGTLVGGASLVALGFGAAAWLFYPSTPAEELVRRIDWDDLNGNFRIRNVKLEMRTDREISRSPFPVISFQVEALDELPPSRQYVARFYDTDGIEISTPDLVSFEPNYFLKPPGAGSTV